MEVSFSQEIKSLRLGAGDFGVRAAIDGERFGALIRERKIKGD